MIIRVTTNTERKKIVCSISIEMEHLYKMITNFRVLLMLYIVRGYL